MEGIGKTPFRVLSACLNMVIKGKQISKLGISMLQTGIGLIVTPLKQCYVICASSSLMGLPCSSSSNQH